MSRDLLKTLINASEKAANIARKCRADVSLLSLLVQEKTKEEANTRFVRDFKTLADVLIQETIRHDVGAVFPEIRESIKGEESSTFTNTLGDSVCVVIGENVGQTTACLRVVLNGNEVAADILAHEVHKEVNFCTTEVSNFPDDLNYSTLGIWIDPIDATAEYIAGDTLFSSFPGITSTGLDCVTILIGVYNKETGCPILGIVSQPFNKKNDINSYESKLFWGICMNNNITNNIENIPKTPNKVAVFSSSENPDVIERVKFLDYEIAFSAGAGHKALKVITGEADLYLLTKSSTFKWDTCGPQAILNSLGGGMYDFKKSLKEGNLVPISYKTDGDKSNTGGIIAIRNVELFDNFLQALGD